MEQHDEIFHFEIFKKFMKIAKYFKTLFWKHLSATFHCYFKVT